jgi:hypothetical protein
MKARKIILNEIKNFPEPFIREVLDFIHFLKTKVIKEKMKTTVLSESSLKKDWLREEEEQAWKNL